MREKREGSLPGWTISSNRLVLRSSSHTYNDVIQWKKRRELKKKLRNIKEIEVHQFFFCYVGVLSCKVQGLILFAISISMFDTSPHHNKERSWQQARINIGEQRSPAVSWKINTLWGSLGWEESKQEDPPAILLTRDALIYTISLFRRETWKKQLGVGEQKTYRSFSARHLGMIQLRFDWAAE